MAMKQKVIKEIMDLMDQGEGEDLKKKSPKFMAAAAEVEPEPMEEMGESEESEEMMPKMGEESEEELSPEMIQKLMEMMEG